MSRRQSRFSGDAPPRPQLNEPEPEPDARPIGVTAAIEAAAPWPWHHVDGGCANGRPAGCVSPSHQRPRAGGVPRDVPASRDAGCEESGLAGVSKRQRTAAPATETCFDLKQLLTPAELSGAHALV